MTLGLKALVWQLAVWGIAALTLFAPAGTLAWPAGWLFFILFFGFVGGLSIFLLIQNAQLLDERMTLLRHDQPFWDQIFLLSFYLLSLAWLALMPLDAVRWRWSQMPGVLQVIGVSLLLCSCAGIFLTIRENSYLSPVVRMQKERGHTLITAGPYRLVRHPLYSSAFLFYLAVPLLLGSWWGLALAPLFIGLMIWRAVQEERFLRYRLAGYERYLQQVPRRFIPGVGSLKLPPETE